MPGLTVVRPMKVTAYECDAPTCREACESSNGWACGWLTFTLGYPVADPETRRWFCSWACLAAWARIQHEVHPLQTRQAERSTYPPLPF